MTVPSTSSPQSLRARPGHALQGVLLAPGDKSVSHRALIFGALAEGRTRISGLLESADVLATADAVRAMGARIERDADGVWSISGTGGEFRTERATLDFGNSGTGARLMMGAIAGAGGSARLVGDESLSARPMARVLDPLAKMGAVARANEGKLPVEISGSELRAIDYTLPVASAQVKSALLLAGLGAEDGVTVREPEPTRDHTERMLPLFGGRVSVTAEDGLTVIRLPGPQTLTGADITIPGDPSSAAFACVAALIVPGSEITIEGIMDNPARSGLYAVLERMGASLTDTSAGHAAGEALINLEVVSAPLHGIDLEADIAPSLIDEYPVLAVAAAFADGPTRLRGLSELRAKESDRLAATAALLTANGVKAAIEGDDLLIEGRGPGGVPGGALIETRGDHRIAMAALVMGMAARQPVTIDDARMIATSYPGFAADMRRLGARVETL